MAVYAAHLTRTLQGTPSIFQIAAQEALGSTIKPALRKLVEYLAVVYPGKGEWCSRWFDELYLLLDCCLQYHYLKHYAASFSESFYGLLRVPISVDSEFNSGHYRLPKLLERGSLAFLVFVPYLRDKVEKIIDRWREEHEDGRLGKSAASRVRAAAVRAYGVAYCLSALAALAQAARYVTGRARAPALPLAALGLALRDAPPRDRDAYTWADLARSLRNGRLGSAMLTFPMVGGLALRGVEYGAFLVQFLRWWDAAAARSGALPPPPPPQKDELALRWMNKCPICLNAWRVPTVLPVSGVVFCYACIARELRARGRCPATRCPADAGSLLRLYLG